MIDERQQAILYGFEKFVTDEVRPYVNQFEQNQGVPDSLINNIAANKYLAAPVPVEKGGLGLDAIHYGLFTEIIGKACIATRSLITVHTSLVLQTLMRWGNKYQKSEWLPRLINGQAIAAFGLSEPETGSDAKDIKTTWQEIEKGYLINGVKKWITFGDKADVFIIIAANHGKSTAFLVERSTNGFETRRIPGMIAGRATYLAEVYLNNVIVTKENVIGPIHQGFEYIVSTALDYGRYSIAWAGVAIAQEALEAMISYAKTRIQFGKPLRDFQLIRGMIADAAAKVRSARSFCLQAAKLREQKSEDAIIETAMAKYFSSKVAVEVTNDALQIHGANGFSDAYPVERLYREAKVLEVIEGSSQMQQEIIASHVLAQYGISTLHNASNGK